MKNSKTNNMKKWLETNIGKSWKTTLISYFMAILLAVQPMLTETIDFNSRHEVARYAVRVIFAAAIALFGKIAADSSQVKHVDAKVEELKNE